MRIVLTTIVIATVAASVLYAKRVNRYAVKSGKIIYNTNGSKEIKVLDDNALKKILKRWVEM